MSVEFTVIAIPTSVMGISNDEINQNWEGKNESTLTMLVIRGLSLE